MGADRDNVERSSAQRVHNNCSNIKIAHTRHVRGDNEVSAQDTAALLTKARDGTFGHQSKKTSQEIRMCKYIYSESLSNRCYIARCIPKLKARKIQSHNPRWRVKRHKSKGTRL